MSIRIERLTGSALREVLEDVARLRIAVFREWPYLYDGTLDYERHYLADFAEAFDAVIVTARDEENVVGAATAAPLAGHTKEFVPLFAAHGMDPDRIFYFGESVLLAAYRGQGLGHAFFDHREAHARAARGPKGAYTHAAFCAVVRADNDPRRPPGYRPLDTFWQRRGYRKVAGLIGSYRWKEIGEAEETEKPMQFWMKAL
ncbi:MAG TPA: GNAT family N-acetyltransferase [Hyphomicrobiaceae bacterium]|nr:GNAT family N-acetyltransferase [Hyphomicrobiaceae bacterium]